MLAGVGFLGLVEKTNAEIIILGTCKFYASNGYTVTFERNKKVDCDAKGKNLIAPWKESTLEQYEAEVAKYNAIGTCITKVGEKVTKREKTISAECDRPIGGETKRWIPDNRENWLGVCEDNNKKLIKANVTKKICEELLLGIWRLNAGDAADLGEDIPPTTGGDTPPQKETGCLSPQILKDGKCVEDKNYHFLAPLPCENGTPGCVAGELETFDPTGENKIGGYLNVMIRIFIGICAVLAVIMIVVGGIEYMTSELISNKENGKHRITGAIFGLVLALGAWTLLNTINPDLLNTELKSLKNVEVTVTLDQQKIIDSRSGKGNCTVVTDPNSACFPDKLKNDFIGTKSNAAPFNTLAAQASAICQLESNAVSNMPIGRSPSTFLDKCSDDKPFSFGLFQINAAAHRANIPACANAFEIPAGDGQSQGNCLKKDKKSGYCMQWSCKTIEPAYTACQNFLTNPINNIKYASGSKLSRWSSWTTYNSCKGKF
ncbi:MAG: hypothetical protein UU10_C0026G0003 [Parcubacteria group bacterium GW2011_GWF1_40_6]|nr:MAG: hypothetical protein UT78_C0007G0022 [Candidatus Nomurabacteria bacterium GW2011_GWF2_40_12]KKR68370.1 MAG: hypothetical protein UU10_C0026G0003 [Parcubacteria group bacterium GW2011_GWF1_40_6]